MSTIEIILSILLPLLFGAILYCTYQIGKCEGKIQGFNKCDKIDKQIIDYYKKYVDDLTKLCKLYKKQINKTE